ncbi:MAG: A24 family peptidase [Cardiobacteriaceae bacterium]|nr:A24 family peptidase [Cardiobacteriaceae bacterium]
MNWLEFFQGGWGIALIALLGLMVGSFLNVVVYRLPVMMDREEKAYAWEVLHGEESALQNPCQTVESVSAWQQLRKMANPFVGERFNLAVPASRCPHCKTEIRAWQNIPVFSYLYQGGKCVACRVPITSRYVWVEILCAVLSVLVVLRFPDPSQLWLALLLTWCLLALFFIDAETQYLPDAITLPLMWLGIMAAWWGSGVFVGLKASVLGAALGYLSLWSVYWLFKIFTGKEGMGYGDFKLLAVLCAWQGISVLPFILFGSALVGLIFGVVQKVGFGKPMAFGPYLILAGWVSFMYGEQILPLLGFQY